MPLPKRNNRRAAPAALILSLLLTLGIWLIRNLSQEYSDIVSVPVVAHSNIKGRSDTSSEAAMVVARCKASGFYLVSNHLFPRRRPLDVNIAAEDLRHKEGDYFTISLSALTRYASDIFGSEVSLESFVSQNLLFRFPSRYYRRLPVKAVEQISFRPQYMALDDMILSPDSVTVYGDSSRLRRLDAILTEPIFLSDLRGSAHGVAALNAPAGVRLAEKEVNYSLDVVRYVEVVSESALSVSGAPASVNLLLNPRRVRVSYRCIFPFEGNPFEKMKFYIDYKDFESSISGRCAVRCDDSPDGVIDFSVEPEICECVLVE